jgi:predicted nucleotidyltransferase
LERQLGADWTAIRKARSETWAWRERIARAFEECVAPDTSLVLFGSIARAEMTAGSDSDWILLVDGQASPQHTGQEQDIARQLEALGLNKPGKSGVFGRMIASHDLIHEIGGEDDTNSNTTRRVLLLLESLPIGNREAYDRVRRQILHRYLLDDRGLLFSTGSYKVPRFLLNDLTRYWRTVTVDFVYKQRSEAGRKWALRNTKLRMSRKLVFASGLLRCFFCDLDVEAAAARDALRQSHDATQLVAYMEQQMQFTPLELIARAAMRPAIDASVGRKLFDSYDRFLAVLDDRERRGQLEAMTQGQMSTSPVWAEIREFSREFQTGLMSLFFGEDKEIRSLTEEYGVF